MNNNVYILTSTGELCHYGVKGQKWGIRRYQNPDGSLTAAGKKRARQEYKADNKTAHELGKKATIYGNAAVESKKRTIKLENELKKRLDSDPDGQKRSTNILRRKYEASSATTAELRESYKKHRTEAKNHHRQLIDKYGREAVSSIKYKNVKLPKGEHSPESLKTMNEKTRTLSDYAVTGVSIVASFGAAVMGSRVIALSYPKSAKAIGRDVERDLYRQNLENVPDKRTGVRE